MTPSARYLDVLRSSAEETVGRPLGPGTVVVAESDRAGTGSATCYPLGDTSIVWCAAEVADRLGALESSTAIDASVFVAAAADLGATFEGFGRNRVLDGAPRRPDARLVDGVDLHVRHLDPTDPSTREILARLVADCDADDVEEADLDLDHLDPTIAVLVAPGDTVVAYASGRPHELDTGLDDIAVLTHPEWRGRRLGALAVYEYIGEHRPNGRRFLYRCNVDNVASNHVAESLGFTLANTIGAVSFDR